MILRVYRVNEDLPEELTRDVLECNSIWDIPPGIYKDYTTIEVKESTVEDLLDALEDDQISTFEFEMSDIVEMLPDENMLNNRGGDKVEPLECNFLIMTGLGWQQIAVDKEAVFREISLQALYEMFYRN